jgi:N-acetylmuramoyl-L-alanine amidase
MPNYTVVSGDCLSSLAKKAGLSSWKTIYDAPENAEFRKRRPNPDLLYPGDVLFIPEISKRTEGSESGKRHRFKSNTKPAWLRLRIQDEDGKEIQNRKYSLTVGKTKYDGQTDPKGIIEKKVAADAQEGLLTIYAEDSTTPWARWNLKLGDLDPIEEIRGIQQRLNHLGYFCGPSDGIVGPRTKAAIQLYQKENNQEQTGEIDDALSGALKDDYGC